MNKGDAKLELGRIFTLSPHLWRICVGLYNKRRRYRSLQGIHPLDRAYGVDTGGAIPGWLLGGGSNSARHSTCYVGCQPSCLRAALSFLAEDIRGATFVDLGCGKGRAMVVASEYPFEAIMGVEMSPRLCGIARRNMAALQPIKKLRVAPDVVCGDALAFGYPPGALVVFLYHSFGLPILRDVLDKLESLPRTGQEVFLIYENPVYGEALDHRSGFERWFARNVPADADELPFHAHAGGQETVVVWRRSSSHRRSPDADSLRKIVVEEEGWRAILS